MTEFALRPDGAGPRCGSERLFSNRIRGHFVGIGVGRSAVAETPPGPTADRKHRRMASARRLSRPIGANAAGGDGGAAARLARRLVALGERRETPEPAR